MAEALQEEIGLKFAFFEGLVTLGRHFMCYQPFIGVRKLEEVHTASQNFDSCDHV